MRQKEDLVTERVADGCMVVPVGGSVSQPILSLNESGAFVWELLKEERSREELVKALIDCYGIDRALAEHDLDDFLTTVRDYITA